jgi:hypothetical protein
LSSAILYLAIVAIWAVVLVPRWLRPRPAQPAERFTEQPAAPAAPEPVDADQPQEAEPGGAPAWAEAAAPAEPAAGPVPAPLSPAERHAEVLWARRRMLAMLVTLTIGAVGLAVTGIAASWVIIPPVVLLAGFLVLLREASHSDAVRSRRATEVHHAATRPVAGQEPMSAGEDAEASPYQVPLTATAPDPAEAAPGAEVIDISARVSDQVYDQYADAAERAVGD